MIDEDKNIENLKMREAVGVILMRKDGMIWT